jgi:excinuclease ABC subunit C
MALTAAATLNPVSANPAFDLQSFLASLPTRPGVYRMLGKSGEILYVGKARHLRNRVSSYFQGRSHADRTQALLAQVASIEITVTASETEALLLEFNLIKQHRPRYNVLLKDDKSFPFIHVSGHEFPRIAFYRGARRLPGRFFGPYPNSVATRETLLLLQKLFRLRPCEDTFFANRSRPCLQYQIGRCTGPCVGLVSREQYAQDVADGIKLLDGRNTEVIEDLGRRMDAAAATLAYEEAARLRDQISMLKQIQATQVITRMAGQDIDAVGIAEEGGEFCVSQSSSCAAAAISAVPIIFQRVAWAGNVKCSAHSWRSSTSHARRRPRCSCSAPSKTATYWNWRCRRRQGTRCASAAACAACARAGSRWP